MSKVWLIPVEMNQISIDSFPNTLQYYLYKKKFNFFICNLLKKKKKKIMDFFFYWIEILKLKKKYI